jgi:4-hydroxythreonine-4-phosphate dehydrogenase
MAQDPRAHAAARPLVGVTMGDPLGIGPEVVVKALSDRRRRRRARFAVFGTGSAMHAAADASGIEPYWWRAPAGAPTVRDGAERGVLLVDYEPGVLAEVTPPAGERGPTATAAGGSASFRFVDDAIAAARGGDPALPLDALVTAPISKEAWALAGHARFPGHTELLASRCRAKRFRMMFVSPELNVILATTHIPLMEIRNRLSIGCVFETLELGAEACARLGIEEPRIAVCGLNPHAGEGGLLGEEEGRVIEPAISMAREQGIDARGPFPGDTVFNAARAGRFDLVVAMYHDQGLIPVKLLAFDRAVNMTVGLPFVRTSPDHGTAFDIAGRNLADASSIGAAIDLAITLASSGSDAPVSR